MRIDMNIKKKRFTNKNRDIENKILIRILNL